MNMPASLVTAPGRVPVPFGLFSTFTFRPPGGDRWDTAGVEFDTDGCGPLAGYGPAGYCADPDDVTGLPRDLGRTSGGAGAASPFTVYGTHQCTPVGNSETQARDKALSRLANSEERAVEHTFWTGLLGNRPNLRGAEVITDTPVKLDVGIGLLEDFLARSYGSQGVIHMPRTLAGGPVKQVGQTLRTLLGTPVAAGSGYDGTSPAGARPAGGTGWIYATPALTGWRTEPVISAVFNQRSNDMTAVAERTYLLAYEDCGAAAVLVTWAAPEFTLAAPATNPYITT